MNRLLFIILVYLTSTKLAAQTVTASPAKSVDLHQWVDNPLKVEVHNLSCNTVVVRASKGEVKGTGCALFYVAASDTIRTDTLSVGFRKARKIIWLSKAIYNVRPLLDPVAKIAGIYRGDIIKAVLLASFGLSVPNCDFGEAVQSDRRARVKSYSVSIIRDNSVMFSESGIQGYWFSKSFLDFIRTKSKPGDEITFDHLVCLLFEKETRPLKQRITLTLR